MSQWLVNGMAEAGLPVTCVETRMLLTARNLVQRKMLLDVVRYDPVYRRLMTAPGVGAVVALTYLATVDQPSRFVHSRAVRADPGLTPRRRQSGDIDNDGAISKSRDTMLRMM